MYLDAPYAFQQPHLGSLTAGENKYREGKQRVWPFFFPAFHTIEHANDSGIIYMKIGFERVELRPAQGSSVGPPRKGPRLGFLPPVGFSSPQSEKSNLPSGPTLPPRCATSRGCTASVFKHAHAC